MTGINNQNFLHCRFYSFEPSHFISLIFFILSFAFLSSFESMSTPSISSSSSFSIISSSSKRPLCVNTQDVMLSDSSSSFSLSSSNSWITSIISSLPGNFSSSSSSNCLAIRDHSKEMEQFIINSLQKFNSMIDNSKWYDSMQQSNRLFEVSTLKSSRVLGSSMRLMRLELPICREITQNEQDQLDSGEDIDEDVSNDGEWIERIVKVLIALPYEEVGVLMSEDDANGCVDNDGFLAIQSELAAIAIAKAGLDCSLWTNGTYDTGDNCQYMDFHESSPRANEDNLKVDVVVIPRHSLKSNQLNNDSKMLLFTPHTIQSRSSLTLPSEGAFNVELVSLLNDYPVEFHWRLYDDGGIRERFSGDFLDPENNPEQFDLHVNDIKDVEIEASAKRACINRSRSR